MTLASSARSIANQSVTMTKEATTNANAKQFNGEDMASKKILGIRIHFPDRVVQLLGNASSRPFDIPAYADKDSLQGTSLVSRGR